MSKVEHGFTRIFCGLEYGGVAGVELPAGAPRVEHPVFNWLLQAIIGLYPCYPRLDYLLFANF
jgi:hypothetical protein